MRRLLLRELRALLLWVELLEDDDIGERCRCVNGESGTMKIMIVHRGNTMRDAALLIHL
jgi:hypothetical protein